MSKACEDWGGGPRSSALVAGHTAEQRDLASALAKLKSKEACVLFPSGSALSPLVRVARRLSCKGLFQMISSCKDLF